MNLLFRLLWVMSQATLAKKRLGLFDEATLSLRVLPTDLDANMHMNNGRYLSLMDLGRIDLMTRQGLLMPILKRGYRPVLAGSTIRYRKPLSPMQTYQLVTKLSWWDDKWLYLEQRFEVDGKVYAVALVKAVFLKGRESVPVPSLLGLLGSETTAPNKPKAVELWQMAEAQL